MTNQERALWVAVKNIRRRLTVGGGGVPPAAHATTHSSGGTDPIDVTDLDGFPGDASLVLLGDGTFGPALSGGGGQWIHVPVGDGRMLLNAEGHPVLIWWSGP